jgi:hypothetical protein
MTTTGRWIGIAALVGWIAPLMPGVARADHDMATMSENRQGGSELSVGLSVEAAEFDTTYYVGSYQGITPSLGWVRGRFGASAMIGLYHLTENGLSTYGAGDAMLGGMATVIDGEALRAGVALHAMLPTGYGRALVGLGGHNHGLMPLVDPMNLQELTFSAAADLDVGHGLQVGARALGGVPIGTGQTHAIGGGRLAWGTPRVSTGLEVQVGLAGDPFTVRGVLDTALRF